MKLQIWRFVALLSAAFSLSLSMTHLLEMPRRMLFDRELWVRVTVVEGVYALFGSVGAIFELGAILSAFAVAFLVRKRGKTFYWTLGGAAIFLLAFVSWIVFVASANAELARWLTNPVPLDWTRTRNQWESVVSALRARSTLKPLTEQSATTRRRSFWINPAKSRKARRA